MTSCEYDILEYPAPLLTLYITKDYIVQTNRFLILEELGCGDALENAGLSILLDNTILIVFPLLSLILYSRKF